MKVEFQDFLNDAAHGIEVFCQSCSSDVRSSDTGTALSQQGLALDQLEAIGRVYRHHGQDVTRGIGALQAACATCWASGAIRPTLDQQFTCGIIRRSIEGKPIVRPQRPKANNRNHLTP